MKVIADFGDFQVVETGIGIDLVDISPVYHRYNIYVDPGKYNKTVRNKKRKRKMDEEEQSAYLACAITFAATMFFIIKWLLFGY